MCRDIEKIEGLIKQCLPIPQKLYQITRRLKTKEEEVEGYFPGLLVFTDCTEQSIPGPTKNRKKRRPYYSGKRKKHARTHGQEPVRGKQKGTANIQKYNSKHRQIGKINDYNIKNNRPAIPKDVLHMFDLGLWSRR